MLFSNKHDFKKCFFRKLSIIFLSLFAAFSISSGYVSAANYPIAAFALYGQQTYGSSNSWVTELPYAGSSMHSVYSWRVYTGNIPTQNAGRYAGVSISGFINVPIDFNITLNQGLTITDCSLGGTSATLSDVTASWTFNAATQDTPAQILYAAESTLDFGSNEVSGNLYCTLSSNNGVYFLNHQTSGVGTVSFGTTNFNVNFANTLSEELLQRQVEQNQAMIDDSREYYDKTYESIDNISEQSTSDIQGSENQKTTDLISALGSLVGAFTSIQPASDCNIQLDFPEYAGGTQIVNLCQYKEKAPLIPIIGSSVLLVIFGMKYFHVIIIKIYRVIRSFIDGTDDTEGED